jgi:hypothetical protein
MAAGGGRDYPAVEPAIVSGERRSESKTECIVLPPSVRGPAQHGADCGRDWPAFVGDFPEVNFERKCCVRQEAKGGTSGRSYFRLFRRSAGLL